MTVIRIQEAKGDLGPSIGAGVIVKAWATPGRSRSRCLLLRALRRRYMIRTIGRRLSR